MSGAAAWLAAIAVYSSFAVHASATHSAIDGSVLVLGTTVAAGAALAPDLDNYSSTVVSAFGFVGKGVGRIVDAVSVAVYNLTKSSREEVKDYGHRTLFHTLVAAILAGLGVSALTASTTLVKNIPVLGTLTWGQIWSTIIMAIFLNLGLTGLFSKQIKKYRAKFGPTIILLLSVVLAIVTAALLPPGNHAGSYSWLGLAVGFGWFIHLLGDAITKQGVPLLWPLRIRRKAWYDIALPSIFRIKAGGSVETVILLPLFIVATLGLAIYDTLVFAGVVK